LMFVFLGPYIARGYEWGFWCAWRKVLAVNNRDQRDRLLWMAKLNKMQVGWSHWAFKMRTKHDRRPVDDKAGHGVKSQTQ
jgi:hypothetical protein